MPLRAALFLLAFLLSLQHYAALHKQNNFVPTPVSYLHYPHETKNAKPVPDCFLNNLCRENYWRLMYNAITRKREIELIDERNGIGRGLLQFSDKFYENEYSLPYMGELLTQPLPNKILNKLALHGKEIIERPRAVLTDFLNPVLQFLPQHRALNFFNNNFSHNKQPLHNNGFEKVKNIPIATTTPVTSKVVYNYSPGIQIDAHSHKYFVNVKNVAIVNQNPVSDESFRLAHDTKRVRDNTLTMMYPAQTNTVLSTTAHDMSPLYHISQTVSNQEITKSTVPAEVALALSTPRNEDFETSAVKLEQQSQRSSEPSNVEGNARRTMTTLNITPEDTNRKRRQILLDKFTGLLDKLDRKFYTTTFNKLLLISPPDRHENGISFVQSGLFLSLLLMALSTETDAQTAMEMDNFIGFGFSHADKIDIINEFISSLPKASDDLKWRWASRLVLGSQNVSEQFRDAAAGLCLNVSRLDGTEPEQIMDTLNKMVEEDTAGAIHDTFEPDEVSEGVRAVAISSLYLRARWRSAPTVLNGTKPFRDADGTPARKTRMIRINDVMRYADLDHFGCQAVEISYATPGLTLLILVPYSSSLRSIVQQLAVTSLGDVTSRMETMRVAVSMPLYTLRMTLLLPSKLESMGVHSLVDWRNDTAGGLRLSHAVQRLMFWAEAGRNAFKDDGIEWDGTPEMELVVDRPYLFFVRWHNVTLMNGNFVL